MALELDIQKKTIYTDRVTLDIEDVSTGWGDPIDGGGDYPLRADVGIHLQGWEMNYKSERANVLTISNTDAPTVSVWQLTFTSDCWFQINFFAVKLWTAGSYAADRVVSYLGKIYLATATTTAVPGTVGGGWSEVTDPETLIDTDEEEVLAAYSTDVFFARDNDMFSTNLEGETMDMVDKLDIFDKNSEQRDDIFQMVKKILFVVAAEWNQIRGDHYKSDLILKKGNDL
ncbi:MAG TPA: hypothetical protein VI489_04290 [Candidatus Brocadiaceae bacterium]